MRGNPVWSEMVRRGKKGDGTKAEQASCQAEQVYSEDPKELCEHQLVGDVNCESVQGG